MDHNPRKNRIALPGADFNMRSCTTFFPNGNIPGKQVCPLPPKPMPVQEAMFPQMVPVDHRPTEPSIEAMASHPDVEFVTLPVWKHGRMNEPPPYYNQTDLALMDGRHHPEGNTPFDMRGFQNLSYSAMPEHQTPPYPYYYHHPQPLRPPLEACNVMAFQPPPRSPRAEGAARALVPQYAPPRFDMQHCKNEEALFLQKKLLMNMPKRKCTSDVQLPVPLQWIDMNRPKTTHGIVMKTIPERGEGSRFDFGRGSPLLSIDEGTVFKAKHGSQADTSTFSNGMYSSDQSGRQGKPQYRMQRRRLHKYSGPRTSRDGLKALKNESSREGLESCMSPLNISSTSHSSLESFSYMSSQRSRSQKLAVCGSCSEDSDRLSGRSTKHTGRNLYSSGVQTDFLKSPLEEKFLFRETVLFGCDEISKWARKLPRALELFEMGDYIRDKTKQSRAQNICSALGPDMEDHVIISEYLKVFLKLADTWLEARNCFGLTENCKRRSCHLNNLDISRSYLEWQHASRRLLGNIIHGVSGVLAQQERSDIELACYPACEVLKPPQFPVPVVARMDCRLTRSTSNLQKLYSGGPQFPPGQNKRAFHQRQKWTISDTASTTSHCSSSARMAAHARPPDFVPRFVQSQPFVDHAHFPTDYQPLKIADIPQHKITLLSQIEPPCVAKQDASCPTVDIAAWFSCRNNDAVRAMPQDEGRDMMSDPALNPMRFSVPPPPIQQQLCQGKPHQPCPKPNVQKSQSMTVIHAQNDSSQDSSDDVQQKVYLKPGSYNVPKKKLTNAKKQNNVAKAKEACCGDPEVPRGYVVPFVNVGPFVPPPSRGLQNHNIKIVKKGAGTTDNLSELSLKPDAQWKVNTQREEKPLLLHKAIDLIPEKEVPVDRNNLKSRKLTTKTMKTDEWLLSTLVSSQSARPESGALAEGAAVLEGGAGKEEEGGKHEERQEASHSQPSSDKSSCGLEEVSQSSVSSRTVCKNAKAGRQVWHNSKRRRVLSQRTSLRMDDILNDLWSQEVPAYMKQAVKSTQIADYYKIVKHPIFLETIINKAKNRIYETMEQFVHDCRRMIFNSSLYFQKDKTETNKIEKFGEHLEKVMQEYFENWDCCNHITGDPREVHFFPELRYSVANNANGKKRSKTPKNNQRRDDKDS